MKHLYLGILLFAAPFLTKGQEVVKCYTFETQQRRQAEDPAMASKARFEEWLRNKIDEGSGAKSGGAELVLPLIFHVVHAGEPVGVGLNVSASAIYAQIQQLNNDYGRTPGTSGFNDNPVGADMNISFCPALTDPQGNTLAEPGIERINGSNRSWGGDAYSTSYFDYFVKPETIWNPDDYLNIWVSPTSSYFYMVLGYAQFPEMSGLPGLDGQPDGENTDGIVVSPYTLGSTDQPNPDAIGNTGMGRTLTHEMGHFLGLRHIWGDGGCQEDDYCADTPPSNEANEDCPTSAFSCGSADMIENYMDYTDDPCKNVFTQDQKARVLTVLANSPRRFSLVNSEVCQGPQPCAAPSNPVAGLDAEVNSAGALLSWVPQTNTLGCQVRIGFANGDKTKDFVKSGVLVSDYHISASDLIQGKSYRWKVRCGCSGSPLIAGPWSGWQEFVVPQYIPGMSPVSTPEPTAQPEFSLYPNPAKDRVRLKINGFADQAVLQVYNLLGEQLVNETLVNSSGAFVHELVLPAGYNGVCFVKLSAQGKSVVRKLVVKP